MRTQNSRFCVNGGDAAGSVVALIARTSSPRDLPAPSDRTGPLGQILCRCAVSGSGPRCSETPWRQSSFGAGDPATPRWGGLCGEEDFSSQGRDRPRRTVTGPKVPIQFIRGRSESRRTRTGCGQLTLSGGSCEGDEALKGDRWHRPGGQDEPRARVKDIATLDALRLLAFPDGHRAAPLRTLCAIQGIAHGATGRTRHRFSAPLPAAARRPGPPPPIPPGLPEFLPVAGQRTRSGCGRATPPEA